MIGPLQECDFTYHVNCEVYIFIFISSLANFIRCNGWNTKLTSKQLRAQSFKEVIKTFLYILKLRVWVKWAQVSAILIELWSNQNQISLSSNSYT